MAKESLITPPDFDPIKAQEFFERRGWKVELLPVSNVDLVKADQGAALECVDGRFGNLDVRKKHGPKLPGGINCITSLITGGDLVGLNSASYRVKQLGYNPGTHGDYHPGDGCGFFALWKNGRLMSTSHKCALPIDYIESNGYQLSHWIKLKMRNLGGKHFTLPGNHEEEGLILNPFKDTTVKARADRFSFDKWFLRDLGVSEPHALAITAETIEHLAAPHTKVEILIP